MTKRLTPQEKLSRKPASRACTFCHQKHLQCSNERPCKNCVKRNIADQCQDITRKRVKYLTGANSKAVAAATTPEATTTTPKRKQKRSVKGSPSISFPSSSISPINTSTFDTNGHPNGHPNDLLRQSLEASQAGQAQAPSLLEIQGPFPQMQTLQPTHTVASETSSSYSQVQPQHHPESSVPPSAPPESVDQLQQLMMHDSAYFNTNNVALNPTNVLEADPFDGHTNTMLNTTTDVLNKLLNDHYEIDNILQPPDDALLVDQQQSSSEATGTSASKAVPMGPSHSNTHFSSNYLNEEYLMLGDILLQSKPTSPSPSNTSASEYNMLSPSYTQNIDFDNIHLSKRKVVQKLKDSRPFISLGFPKDSSLSLDNLNNMAHQTDNLLDNNVSSRGNNNTSNQKLQSAIASKTSKTNPIINFATKYSTEYVSPLSTHQIYQTVSDIYSKDVLNYEYPNSYHALTHFLKTRFSGNNLPHEEKARKRQNLLVILKLIASYRPTFISAHKSLLKPQDLLFLEMSFQRCLIDYEKLSQLNSSPTIIWRRTGEIVSITDDLLSLLGYKLLDILSKRTFIMEIMYDDESIVKYFQLFKSVAVGNLHSSINTKVKLIKNGGAVPGGGTSNGKYNYNNNYNHNYSHNNNNNNNSNNSNNNGMSTGAGNSGDGDGLENNVGTNSYIEFCSVWTVKRDLFDIPMLIIGQFLPILPAGDGVRMY
ncbi:conserved hypothetical protein [Lodderomyces elongisporus NRRL YB-4239]|uniref:Glucose starvation modulator protein 1 n=1 Tax=Lodderomyces elongisporus (strain ATCC 11503 / CBS 2605 / JCM 1781 / NBRC 1676 / NRRL YB-4239) TaxID=379508 RepID=GSM1_LODEL|nr:RecName: Full=Glucose starvation modulator protein 1 [Lodderomyces elongisporus NRRL YB-4239]EDK42704.1 conserved hypothetical protein [Lodderomyces elongisporus NRRL YB-4239]